jgi:hypothetical protein
MEHCNVQIEDQYGDRLVGKVCGKCAFAEAGAKEIELAKEDLKELRDWCNQALRELYNE